MPPGLDFPRGESTYWCLDAPPDTPLATGRGTLNEPPAQRTVDWSAAVRNALTGELGEGHNEDFRSSRY